MDNKKKKVLGKITNVVVIVILVFVALITLSIILSAGKGYTNLFGNTFVTAISDSMEGTYNDSFNPEIKGFSKGDLFRVKVLSDKEKQNLQVGDVITFYQVIDGERALNTHRIIAVDKTGVGATYVTRGDKATSLGELDHTELVTDTNVIGKYTGQKISGLGNFFDFFRSPTGFFVCVVLPSLLIVAYFVVNLILTVKSVKKVSTEEAKADEKEKMREELMAELREQGMIKEETAAEPEEEPKEPSGEETK